MRVALAELARVDHTMRLEAQGVTARASGSAPKT
jgi:hypothetical protein